MESEPKRVVIRAVRPELECGRFPVKRVIGDDFIVEAVIFADGHDVVSCVLQYRHQSDSRWREAEMEALVNDQWRGTFKLETLGQCIYTLVAWVDDYKSWRRD